MAKWIQKAIKSPGALRAKAKRAGSILANCLPGQYFRKEAKPVRTPEIFTDVKSKIDKYERVLTYFAKISKFPYHVQIDSVIAIIVAVSAFIYDFLLLLNTRKRFLSF
jgi:hypothetical protein